MQERWTRSRAASYSCCPDAATRLAPWLVGLDKRYVTEIGLAARTSTGDPEGEVIEEHEPVEEEELERRLEALRGEIELPIPAASAVKVGGERAYRLARRGIEVEMPLRRSRIDALDVITYTGEGVALDLRVSSGTYVRSIADALGGHCRTLRRTEVGPFRVEDADPERMLTAAEALPFLPAVAVSEEEAGRCAPVAGAGRTACATCSTGSSWPWGGRCCRESRPLRRGAGSRSTGLSRSAPSTASTSATGGCWAPRSTRGSPRPS